MNPLPCTTANTANPQATKKEIQSLKKALGLVLAALPEEQRINVQKALLESFEPEDRDLTTQLNQFIFRGGS